MAVPCDSWTPEEVSGQRTVTHQAGVVLPSEDTMLRVVSQIYSTVPHADFWPRVLGLLTSLAGAPCGLLTVVDTFHPRDSESHVVGLDAEVMTAFAKRHLTDDLVFSTARRLPPETVAIGSELVDPQQVYAHPQWEAFRFAGVDYQLVAVLENRADICAILGLARGTRDFTAEDKVWLQGLVPHLRLTFNLSHRLRQAEAGRRELIQKFDYAREAVVILDRSGYALFVNVTANAILAGLDGLTVKFGRFLFDEVTTQTRFETAVRRALDTSVDDDAVKRSEVRVDRRSGKPPLELVIIPVRRPSDRALLPEGTGCMVLINDPTAPQTIAPSRLVRLYGLTGAEAKVCEALLARGAVDEAAALLHITPNTARSHLKHVYAKLGVSNQAQLMQRLTMLARPQFATDVVGAGIPGSV